ncbi:MAG: hypothetical protein CBE00_13485 [Planctomycetaceae bacterium TMED240]|nr:hypothetical protein [Rhodopirellula sp.]OUX03901.1 MAG: hypothetical protein CBE00_13485 [Planctomycetaceae bacterium TMED240]
MTGRQHDLLRCSSPPIRPLLGCRSLVGCRQYSFYALLLFICFALTGSPVLWGVEDAASTVRQADKIEGSETNDIERAELIEQELQIDKIDRGHWAYRKLTDFPPPDTGQSDWPRTTIDQFILSKLQSHSLSPVSEATRGTLIRRLSFDLTGLPPTSAELSQYLNDKRPGSYRRLVERLLASPHYGRRWGQYWLDLARFAETDGYEHDKIRSNAWRYRDWIVNALNRDIGYDRFITLQLAGDIQPAPDAKQPSSKIATAFLLSGPDMPDINSQQERRHVLLNEITATTGSTLLSLQIGCAECHNHKYDPISQGDFYRLRAFFDRAVKLKTNQSVSTLTPNANPDAASQIHPRGNWQTAGPLVSAAFPRIANISDVQVTAKLHPRVQLARWLTDPGHPLTARSIANRVWQHHFGTGLSNTPSDFGVMGEEPSHPKLLDHIASRLINHDWSLKDLHRQIVLSATYRSQSKPPIADTGTADDEDSDAAQVWEDAKLTDPDNRMLARFPRRRLDAESIRDAMLLASGTLNHQADGPGIRPPLPQALVKTLKSGQWKTSTDTAEHYRRSIYIFARRNLRYPLFATFDRPAANCSCATRNPSTTALQSLLLLNSNFTLDLSKRLASHCINEHSESTKLQTREIFQRVFARLPSSREELECRDFLVKQAAIAKQQGSENSALVALTDLCRALFNSNEFLYID